MIGLGPLILLCWIEHERTTCWTSNVIQRLRNAAIFTHPAHNLDKLYRFQHYFGDNRFETCFDEIKLRRLPYKFDILISCEMFWWCLWEVYTDILLIPKRQWHRCESKWRQTMSCRNCFETQLQLEAKTFDMIDTYDLPLTQNFVKLSSLSIWRAKTRNL